MGKTKAEECMSPLRKCFPASASVLLLTLFSDSKSQDGPWSQSSSTANIEGQG